MALSNNHMPRSGAGSIPGSVARRACLGSDATALWELTREYLEGSGEPRLLSYHTARAYRQGIELLLDRWPGGAILQADLPAARALVRELETSGASPSTVKVRLAAFHALYGALVWTGVRDDDPFRGVQPDAANLPRRKPRAPYNADDIEALLERADPTDCALILLGTQARLAPSQCVNLRWDDVDLAAATLRVESARGEDRIAPLSPDLVAALRALPWRGDRVLGFTSDVRARQRLQRLCAAAGVEYRGVHALRGAVTAPKGERGDRRWDGIERRQRERRIERPPALADEEALRGELARAEAEAERTGRAFGLLKVSVENVPGDGKGSEGAEPRLLHTLGARLSRAVRPYDLVARSSAEPFWVVVRGIQTPADLQSIVRRFSAVLSSDPVVIDGSTFQLLPAIDASFRSPTGTPESSQTLASTPR